MDNFEINSEAEKVCENAPDPVTVPRQNAQKYFLQIGLGILILPLVTTLLQYALAYLFAYNAPNIYSAWWFNWVLSTVPLYFVAFPLFLFVLPKPIEKIGERRAYGAGRFIVTCFISISAMYLFNILGFNLVEGINWLSGGKLGNMDALNELVGKSPMWATVVVACVAAPVMEELIFRKALIDRVLPFGEFKACLLSGLVFGMFHGNFRQFFYAAVLGFIFAFVYVKTRNILYSIGLHMGINILGSVIMPWVLSNKNLAVINKIAASPEAPITNEDAMTVLLVAGTILIGAAAITAGVVLFFVFLRKIKFESGRYDAEGGKVSAMIYANAGTIAAMVIMAANFVLSLL